MIFTQKAIDQINKIKKDKQKPILRLKVEAGGCQGILYRMLLDEKVGPDDSSISDDENFPAITNKKMLPFFDGVQLDFDDDLDGAGFVFSNPTAQSCGCGMSFKVK